MWTKRSGPPIWPPFSTISRLVPSARCPRSSEAPGVDRRLRGQCHETKRPRAVARRVAAGDHRARQPRLPNQPVEQPPEPGSEPPVGVGEVRVVAPARGRDDRRAPGGQRSPAPRVAARLPVAAHADRAPPPRIPRPRPRRSAPPSPASRSPRRRRSAPPQPRGGAAAPGRGGPPSATRRRGRSRRPASRSRSRRSSQRSAPAAASVSSSTTSSATMPPARRSSASRAGPRPALRSSRSISPIRSPVCRARWRRTSASSIGVTGCAAIVGCRSSRWTAPSPARAKSVPKACQRPMSGDGDEERRQCRRPRARSPPPSRSSRRAARCRASSRPCSAGSAPRAAGALAKIAGSSARIHAGLRVRASPASPTARAPGKRASTSGVGGSRKSTVSSPARLKASIVAAEPVKSSP